MVKWCAGWGDGEGDVYVGGDEVIGGAAGVAVVIFAVAPVGRDGMAGAGVG